MLVSTRSNNFDVRQTVFYLKIFALKPYSAVSTEAGAEILYSCFCCSWMVSTWIVELFIKNTFINFKFVFLSIFIVTACQNTNYVCLKIYFDWYSYSLCCTWHLKVVRLVSNIKWFVFFWVFLWNVIKVWPLISYNLLWFQQLEIIWLY